MAVEPRAVTSREFVHQFKAEIAKFAKVIAQANIPKLD